MNPDPNFLPWMSVGAAVAALLGRETEVVLHDLKRGRIVAVWNPVSGRKPGDESLIDPISGEEGEVMGPYRKVGRRGERLKSVSALLRPGLNHEPVGLLCINMDVTAAHEAFRYIQGVLTADEDKPEPLFRGDWRERIQEAVYEAAQGMGGTIASLTRGQRVRIVAALDKEGLFATRNAVDHAAGLLGISRTSLYNYLRTVRSEKV